MLILKRFVITVFLLFMFWLAAFVVSVFMCTQPPLPPVGQWCGVLYVKSIN